MSESVKIKGLLINPEDESITEIEIRKGGGCLQDLYDKIGCDCVDCIRHGIILTLSRVNKKDDIWIDDEGMLKADQRPFWRLPLYQQDIAGRGVVLSVDDEGDCISHTLTAEQIEELKAVIRFYHVPVQEETDTDTSDK